MAVPFLEPAFSNGEITPALWGRLDIEKFHTAAATIRNAWVNFRGGVNSRAGFTYVLMSKQSWLNLGSPPRLITFNFNLAQNYCLEFGDFYMRIYEDGAPVVEAALTILSATNSPDCQIVVPGASAALAAGDWIIFSGCEGATQFNGNTYVIGSIALDGETITLQDFDGGPIDSTAFGVYVANSGQVQRIYTVASPYLASDAWVCKFVQSANVLTMTNPNFPPYNLSRFGPLNWQFAIDVRGPKISNPTGATASATVTPPDDSGYSPPPRAAAYAYHVTAVSAATGEESRPSNTANVLDSIDMAETNGSIIVTWNPRPAAAYYNVYRGPTSYNTDPSNPFTAALPVPVGSLFGLVAQSIGTQLVDNNLTPDFAQSPPQALDPLAPGQITNVQMTAGGSGFTTAAISINTSTGSGFSGAVVIVGGAVAAVLILAAGSYYSPDDTATISGDGSGATAMLTIGPTTGTYPSVVSYFQQRRVFADSLNQPDTYWMSQTGSYDNFDASIPVGDSDAITGTPSGETVDGIQWMLEMPLGLVTFTGAQVLQVTAAGTFISSPTAITPSNQIAVPQSTVGSSSTLQPIRVDWNILHYEPDDAILRELQYQIWFNIYISKDISWQSSHLLFGNQIVDRAWTRKPNYILWHVRNDGILLSTTYVKDQEVIGWARHTTQGLFQSVTSVYESPIDALYAVVERPVLGGASTRYFIERMNDRHWFTAEDPWCTDCSVLTPVGVRAGTVTASSPNGNATFTSSAGVFLDTDVGSTIRFGKGIAVLTAFVSAEIMEGTWVAPCQTIYPDSPTNQVIPQAAGIEPPATDIAGLPPYSSGWLIVGLADGIPVGPLAASAFGGSAAVGGEVTLPFPASSVKLGLGYGVQVQSVYVDTGNPTVQGRVKSISAVTCRVENSAPMMAGANEPDASAQNPAPLVAVWTGLSPAPASPTELPATYISPGTFLLSADEQRVVQPPFTGDIRINVPASWQKRGQVAAQQSLPQPLNLLAFMPEVDEGDTPEQTYSQRPPRPQMELAGMMQRWPQQERR